MRVQQDVIYTIVVKKEKKDAVEQGRRKFLGSEEQQGLQNKLHRKNLSGFCVTDGTFAEKNATSSIEGSLSLILICNDTAGNQCTNINVNDVPILLEIILIVYLILMDVHF